jgi:tripartite-type tricarboxylate transporter receptor subunit TctC
MKLSRRRFLHLATNAAALPALSRFAWAQAYPSRPVRVVVPFGAGSNADTVARLIGQWLSERLGQPFIIENRAGAGGNLATEVVARAPADGYTILLAGSNNAINATLYEKLNFNFIRDITPVASIARVPNVMVVNLSVPAQTIPEFIAYAKSKPDRLSMASAGSGSTPHLCGELFMVMTGVSMLHVPYRGGPPAMTDLIGGQVQVMFNVLSECLPYIQAGRLRPLAVTTSLRSEALADIPTVAEFVRDYEASTWNGVGLPKDAPPEIIDKLNAAINAGLADPKLKARFADLGSTVFSGSPADFGRFIAEETEKWAKVVKFSGAKAD